jgi:hypothetical protein
MIIGAPITVENILIMNCRPVFRPSLKGYKEVEARLQAETAGNSSLVKNLMVRLEDARILENIDGMRKRLSQLKIVNGDLIKDHEIKSNSYGELVATLKELNMGVQNASRLRGFNNSFIFFWSLMRSPSSSKIKSPDII